MYKHSGILRYVLVPSLTQAICLVTVISAIPFSSIASEDVRQNKVFGLGIAMLDLAGGKLSTVHVGEYGEHFLIWSEADSQFYTIRRLLDEDWVERGRELRALNLDGDVLEVRPIRGLLPKRDEYTSYALSPDGSFLAYSDMRGGNGSIPLEVRLVDLATNEIRSLFNEQVLRTPRMVWLSETVLIAGFWAAEGHSPASVLMRFDVANGSSETMCKVPDGVLEDFVMSPERGRLALVVRDDQFRRSFVVLDLLTLTITRTPCDHPWTPHCVWTADGTALVFQPSGHEVALYSLGEPNSRIVGRNRSLFRTIDIVQVADRNRVVFTEDLGCLTRKYHVHVLAMDTGRLRQAATLSEPIFKVIPIQGGARVLLETYVEANAYGQETRFAPKSP